MASATAHRRLRRSMARKSSRQAMASQVTTLVFISRGCPGDGGTVRCFCCPRHLGGSVDLRFMQPAAPESCRAIAFNTPFQGLLAVHTESFQPRLLPLHNAAVQQCKGHACLVATGLCKAGSFGVGNQGRFVWMTTLRMSCMCMLSCVRAGSVGAPSCSGVLGAGIESRLDVKLNLAISKQEPPWKRAGLCMQCCSILHTMGELVLGCMAWERVCGFLAQGCHLGLTGGGGNEGGQPSEARLGRLRAGHPSNRCRVFVMLQMYCCGLVVVPRAPLGTCQWRRPRWLPVCCLTCVAQANRELHMVLSNELG